MLYNNIVVGLDNSQYSEAALIEAANWARRCDGRITVVHAVFFDSEEFSVTNGQLDERIDKGMDLCKRMVKNYSKEFNIEMECIVRQGEPGEVIPDVALHINADLIAMGTYGKRGLKRLVMGSVTADVMLNASCDILVVKQLCEQCNGQYSSLLVPYDGSELGKKAIEKAVAIKNDNSHAGITLIYVLPKYEEMIGFFKSNAIRGKLYDQARKMVMEGEKFAYTKGVSVKTIVEEGYPFEKIVETSKGLNSDLIVMGSHGWRGINRAMMGSTAERVIAYADVPILVAR